MANYLQRILTAGAQIQSSAKPPVPVPAIVPSAGIGSLNLAPPPMPAGEIRPVGEVGDVAGRIFSPPPKPADPPEQAAREEHTRGNGAFGCENVRAAPNSSARTLVRRDCTDEFRNSHPGAQSASSALAETVAENAAENAADAGGTADEFTRYRSHKSHGDCRYSCCSI